MAKKLLNEAQVRRFAKLANLSPINEMNSLYNEEEGLEDEAPMDDIAAGAEEEAPIEMDAELDAEAGEEPIEMDADGAADLEIPESDVSVLEQAAEIINTIVAAAGGGEDELAPPEDVADLGGEDELMPPEEEVELEDEEEIELQEALKGIDYIPGKKEIVQEVAKRVAKRLLAAKKAEKQLQEALGSKRTPARRRRTRK